MELLDLYDDNGILLGKTIKRGERPLKGKIMIAIAIIKNSKDEYLVQKTSKEKGSVFSLTGGHVTHNETSSLALKRELEEEIGLVVDEKDLEFVAMDFHPTGPCLVSIYRLNIDISLESLSLQKEEVDSVYWFSKESIKELIKDEKFHKTHEFFLKKYELGGII